MLQGGAELTDTVAHDIFTQQERDKIKHTSFMHKASSALLIHYF